MKFGTEMGHGTLTTGKILRSGYLGNGCYGDEKTFPILKYSINWRKNVPGRPIMVGSKNLRYLLPWKPRQEEFIIEDSVPLTMHGPHDHCATAQSRR